jgi:hypothetical protein
VITWGASARVGRGEGAPGAQRRRLAPQWTRRRLCGCLHCWLAGWLAAGCPAPLEPPGSHAPLGACPLPPTPSTHTAPPTHTLPAAGGSGFLLPLSGGADSASTAAIVGCMCQMLVAAVAAGDAAVGADVRRVGQYGDGEQVGAAGRAAAPAEAACMQR